MSEPTFAQWLARQIIRRDWTQADLADRLKGSAGAVSMWLGGKRIPDSASCLRLADVFGMDPDDVLLAAGHRENPGGVNLTDPRHELLSRLKVVTLTDERIIVLEALFNRWTSDDHPPI